MPPLISPSLSIPGLMCPNPGPIPECVQSGQLPLPLLQPGNLVLFSRQGFWEPLVIYHGVHARSACFSSAPSFFQNLLELKSHLYRKRRIYEPLREKAAVGAAPAADVWKLSAALARGGNVPIQYAARRYFDTLWRCFLQLLTGLCHHSLEI